MSQPSMKKTPAKYSSKLSVPKVKPLSLSSMSKWIQRTLPPTELT